MATISLSTMSMAPIPALTSPSHTKPPTPPTPNTATRLRANLSTEALPRSRAVRSNWFSSILSLSNFFYLPVTLSQRVAFLWLSAFTPSASAIAKANSMLVAGPLEVIILPSLTTSSSLKFPPSISSPTPG